MCKGTMRIVSWTLFITLSGFVVGRKWTFISYLQVRATRKYFNICWLNFFLALPSNGNLLIVFLALLSKENLLTDLFPGLTEQRKFVCNFFCSCLCFAEWAEAQGWWDARQPGPAQEEKGLIWPRLRKLAKLIVFFPWTIFIHIIPHWNGVADWPQMKSVLLYREVCDPEPANLSSEVCRYWYYSKIQWTV